MIEEKYRYWIENAPRPPYKDEDTLKELFAMKEDPSARHDAFYRPLRFGTGGLRGVMGAGEARMNVYTVAAATEALARYLSARHTEGGVAVAYDSRHSSPLFARVTACVLAAHGFTVHLYPHITPTPMLAFAVRHLGCLGGVMITASHNTKEYNGYKVYGEDGCQITEKAAREIETHMESIDPFFSVRYLQKDKATACGRILFIGEDVARAYTEAVKDAALADDRTKKDVSIVYTPLSGTGLSPVMRVLSECGFEEVYAVPEESEPNGDFPTVLSPNPEYPEALALAIDAAKARGVDLVLATDPDADRLGVAVREGDGSYRTLNGNELAALLLDDLSRYRRATDRMPMHPVAIKTVVSGDLIDAVALSHGVAVESVLTGFKYIGERIGGLEGEGRGEDLILGMEESCGYLSGGYVRDKDGVLAALLCAYMVARDKAAGISTAERLEALYTRHGYTYSLLSSHTLAGEEGARRISSLMAQLRATPPDMLGERRVVSLVDYAEGRNGLPPSNVVRLLLERRCWAVVRPSGTEPKVKIYLSATASSYAAARERAYALLADLQKYFS